jgi:hypothetical protein
MYKEDVGIIMGIICATAAYYLTAWITGYDARVWVCNLGCASGVVLLAGIKALCY